MEYAFPLFRLPNPDQQRVLRCFCHIDQLAFSVLSKKTKSLLHSLKIKLGYVILKIIDPIELVIRISHTREPFQLLLNYDGDFKSVENVPESTISVDRWATVDHQRTAFRSQLTLQDWILHIFHIYHGTHIERLEFSDGSLVYDLSSIKTALRGIEVPLLLIEYMNDENLFKRITETFFKIRKLLIDHTYRPEDTDHLRRILASNFDLLDFTADNSPYPSFLDNLLSINASTISIEYSNMTDRNLNRFLKLWSRGAMPRLKLLSMAFLTDERGQVWNKDVILNGIQYTEMREGEERSGVFEWFYGPQAPTVSNGLNISRCDGVSATVQLDYHDDLFDFNLYVWE